MKKKTSEKKQHPIALAIGCLILAGVMTAGEIYFFNDFSVWGKILSVLGILIMVLNSGLVIYCVKIKKEIEAEQDIETAKYMAENEKRRRMRERCRREQQRLQKSVDMFHFIYHYMLREKLPGWFGALLLGLLMGLCFREFEDYGPDYRMVINGGMIIAVILFICFSIYLLLGIPTKWYKKYFTQKGYNMAELNEEYMHGKVYGYNKGIVNIGLKYTVVINVEKKRQSFIFSNDQINSVEKKLQKEIITTEKNKSEEITRCYVCINVLDGRAEFMVKDVVGDMILEEYEQYGIKTEKMDAIE